MNKKFFKNNTLNLNKKGFSLAEIMIVLVIYWCRAVYALFNVTFFEAFCN